MIRFKKKKSKEVAGDSKAILYNVCHLFDFNKNTKITGLNFSKHGERYLFSVFVLCGYKHAWHSFDVCIFEIYSQKR